MFSCNIYSVVVVVVVAAAVVAAAAAAAVDLNEHFLVQQSLYGDEYPRPVPTLLLLLIESQTVYIQNDSCCRTMSVV